MDEKEVNFEEIAKRYNVDLRKLELEQLKLAKSLEIKDKINFKLAERVAGIENIFVRNRIISALIVLDNEELVEQEYFEDKIRFPYIPGFRAYRELPAMISTFNKLDEKPDLIFIRGHGILHPRGFGIASHFSLAVNVPVIGISDNLIVGEVKKDEIFINNKLSGKIIQTKEEAKPVYVSPGNFISVNTSALLCRKFTKEPHKFPEPLRLAKKYAKEIMKEIFYANEF